MKSLKCSTVTGTTCPYEAHGKNEEEIVDNLKKHGKESHKEMMENMSEEQHKEMMDKMHSVLHE